MLEKRGSRLNPLNLLQWIYDKRRIIMGIQHAMVILNIVSIVLSTFDGSFYDRPDDHVRKFIAQLLVFWAMGNFLYGDDSE